MHLSLSGCTGLMIEKNARPEGGINRCRDSEIHRLNEGGPAGGTGVEN